jgi:hypothetical protein
LVSEASSCVVVARCCPDRYFVNLRSTELDKLHDASVVEMRLMPDKTGSKWRVSSCASACTNDISTFDFLIISDIWEVFFAVDYETYVVLNLGARRNQSIFLRFHPFPVTVCCENC